MTNEQDPQMNASAMYLEEVFTDQTVGQIRKMTPVTSEGEPDAARETLFVGSTQMMTAGGALPLNFEIPASTLSEAISKFSAQAKISMEQTIKEIEAYRREQASSIVVPGQSKSGIQLP
jgi:hypothetical protein